MEVSDGDVPFMWTPTVAGGKPEMDVRFHSTGPHPVSFAENRGRIHVFSETGAGRRD